MDEPGAARVFYGGTVLTMRSDLPCAEALASVGDRIVAVGDLELARSCAPGAEELNLDGGCLMPGLIDAPHHFSDGAFFGAAGNLHWPAVAGVGAVLAAPAAGASATPGSQGR